jgi:hypothetical protein
MDHYISMHQYDSNCTSRTNWSDLAGTSCLGFEPESLNAFESIEVVPGTIFEEEPLEAYFWDQSDVPSPWNTYWTDTAREGGCLDINDPGFGQHWTKYHWLNFGLFTDDNCEEICNCEGHNCVEAQLSVGHAAAAATTAKSLGVPLIVVVPSNPTPSDSMSQATLLHRHRKC